MIAKRNENSASAAFASILGRSDAAFRVFINLANAQEWLANAAQNNRLIKHRSRTDDGRELDILITSGSLAIIVECKVGDAQKPYQVAHYAEHWQRTTGCEPIVVWLVRRPQRVMGAGSIRAVTLTWNALRDALAEAVPAMRSEEAAIVESFCDALSSAQILVPTGTRIERLKQTKGYNQDHALFILSTIRDRVGGLTGEVEEINELPPAVHVGRLSWINKFEDGWLTRLRFILLPYTTVRNRRGPFGFRVTISFFNDMYPAADLEFVRTRGSRWAAICDREGMEFECNAPGKMRGKHNLKLTYPFDIPLRLKNLFARELFDDARRRSVVDWEDDNAAIDAGQRHMEHFLRLMDAF